MPKPDKKAKREICKQCNRPQPVCLCSLIHSIDNTIKVTIYRHPDEVKKAIGTAALAALSLQHCTIIDMDTVTLPSVEKEKAGDIFRVLLFPPIESSSLGIEEGEMISVSDLAAKLDKQPIELLVLDGTWKKARKMYYLSPDLHTLPRLSLTINANQANYTIRKAEKPGQLSTLEAIAAALGQVENNTEKYQPLLDLQQGMVEKQLALMDAGVKRRYE